MKKLIIHPKLKNMFPPLSESQQQGLEDDILQRGCLSPIVVWRNIIVDGHFRYAICEKYDIPFETKEIPFQSLDDAMFWAWQHQENRRNLSAYQRAEIALKFKPDIAAKAKLNMSLGGGNKKSGSIQQNPVTPINTKKELSKMAGVSGTTLAQAEYISDHADDATKQKLRSGETTINREYVRLKEAAKPMLPMPEKTISQPKNQHTQAPETVSIPLGGTKQLIDSIVEHFGVDCLSSIVCEIFGCLRKIKGHQSVSDLLRQLYSLHDTPSMTERKHGIPQF